MGSKKLLTLVSYFSRATAIYSDNKLKVYIYLQNHNRHKRLLQFYRSYKVRISNFLLDVGILSNSSQKLI